MSGLGFTPDGPVDDTPVWDAEALVTCPTCEGHRLVTIERADGTSVKRRCRECVDRHGRATGTVLAGDGPGARYGMTLDFCAGMYDCCGEMVA